MAKRLDVKDYHPNTESPKALFAEFVGTCALVLAAAGAGSAVGPTGGLMGGGSEGAWAAGLTLLVLVLLFGPVSKAVFNPAITIGMAISGHLPKSRVLPYLGVQFLGALLAGLILRFVLHASFLGLTTTQMPGLSALLLEALLTFWLQWVILMMAEEGILPVHQAIAIGFTLAAAGLWAGHMSGASLNPARTLGPAIAAWDFSQVWIYLIGPTLGAACAGASYAWYKNMK